MNLFKIPDKLTKEEISEPILVGQEVLIERIISNGQISSENFWYDQTNDEWVALLQGKAVLGWEDGGKLNMEAGDWVFIPAHKRHRVEFTSNKPPCIWLAVHGKLS